MTSPAFSPAFGFTKVSPGIFDAEANDPTGNPVKLLFSWRLPTMLNSGAAVILRIFEEPVSQNARPPWLQDAIVVKSFPATPCADCGCMFKHICFTLPPATKGVLATPNDRYCISDSNAASWAAIGVNWTTLIMQTYLSSVVSFQPFRKSPWAPPIPVVNGGTGKDPSNRATQVTTPMATYGFNCSRCNSRNDYATPNRPDGTYVCFECR